MSIVQEICRAIREGDDAEVVGALLSRDDRPISKLDLSELVGMAAGLGAVRVLQVLVDAGAPVDEPDHRGYRPLHMLAYSPRRGADAAIAAQRLIDAGADPNGSVTREGLSPLDVAARFQKPEMSRVLHDAGATLREYAEGFTANWLRRAIENRVQDDPFLVR